jgi:DNA-binding response OmpR family regulator
MKKILIVDDEKQIRDLYKCELENEGFGTVPAESGEDALSLIEKGNDIDLIILDIKMNGENGLEILEDIKNKTTKIPIILNSAYSSFKSNFTSWLADAYLVKSPDLTELKTKVRELLTA